MASNGKTSINFVSNGDKLSIQFQKLGKKVSKYYFIISYLKIIIL